jgi:hypothetical protein
MSGADDLEGDDIWGVAGGAAASGDVPAPAPDAAGAGSAGDPALSDQQAAESAEDDETLHMTVHELRQRIHLINNDIRVMKSDVQRITHESRAQRDRIRDNQEKVKLNKQLPYLVANVVEVLEPDAEDGKSLTCVSPTIDCYKRLIVSIILYFILFWFTGRYGGRR